MGSWGLEGDTGFFYTGHPDVKYREYLRASSHEGYREKVKIATKLPSWLVESPADMDRFLDLQLERLDSGHIDFYLLHSLNRGSWSKLEELGVVDFLDRARRSGKISGG